MQVTDRLTLLNGDCLAVMRDMPDASVDSVVCDPPYGLSAEPDMAEVMRHWMAGDDYVHTGSGFMGKSWDSFVPGPSVWREAFRVLKPGGHLAAFFGTRTYDIGTLAIRLAGFEVRDQLAWVYGSGFPKSLDVSKAIDKVNGDGGRLLRFTQWFRTSGVTRKVATDAMVRDGHISPNGTMAGHYFAESERGQPAIPTVAIWWGTLRALCGDVPAWVDELVERIEAERAVIGTQNGSRLAVAPGQGEDRSDRTLNITAPATPEAARWAGWGTALKPAWEPICLARKPLIGTVASNVLAHGTGGLNIDGCRVGTQGEPKEYVGRFPANLIHDGSDEVLAGFPDSGGSGPARTLKRSAKPDQRGWGMNKGAADEVSLPDAGSGSAARFFYCAKASRSDRQEGNDHPTVKPTALMEWLARLVTPPGGLVLDPFMGSGSTGKACHNEGFRFVGVERDPDYYAMAVARIWDHVSA